MTRGQVAERAGVHAETVRYYEQRKLIPRPPRSASGYRQYTVAYVERIRFIKRAQELGFTLSEIQELLSMSVHPEQYSSDVRQRVQVKIIDVAEKIRDLERIQRALVDLATTCDGHAPTSACPILTALRGDTHCDETPDKPALKP